MFLFKWQWLHTEYSNIFSFLQKWLLRFCIIIFQNIIAVFSYYLCLLTVPAFPEEVHGISSSYYESHVMYDDDDALIVISGFAHVMGMRVLWMMSSKRSDG